MIRTGVVFTVHIDQQSVEIFGLFTVFQLLYFSYFLCVCYKHNIRALTIVGRL